MAYMIVARRPTPDEQAKAFWNAIGKLSALATLLVAIRQLFGE